MAIYKIKCALLKDDKEEISNEIRLVTTVDKVATAVFELYGYLQTATNAMLRQSGDLK